MANDVVKERAHSVGHVVVAGGIGIERAYTYGRIVEAGSCGAQGERTGGVRTS